MPGTGKHYDEVAPFGIHVIHFKGPTDPALVVTNFVAPGKRWWDTTTGFMKCRNDADTGWDSLYEVGVSTTGGSPGGTAGGDLAGTYPNPTIKASVALTGVPTVPTVAGTTDSTTKISSTAFVQAVVAAAIAALVNAAPGALDTL